MVYRLYLNFRKVTRDILLIFMSLSTLGCANKSNDASNKIHKKEGQLIIEGRLYPHRYNTYRDRAHGHHFIVWSKGRNAKKALIETPVWDKEILEVLKEMGAKTGNNLSQETWTKREDPKSPEPDKHVQGSRIKIMVEWEKEKYVMHELFKNASAEDFEIRVGGHEHMIPVWKSGCVTCLFSCPGGKTSNAVFTIRDQAMNKKTFTADEENLPQDGEKVKIYFEMVEDQE